MAQFFGEITLINEDDLFILHNHPKADFDYPFHYHAEFEINMVIGNTGQRIVGDVTEDFGELDIVLMGPNIPHSWKTDGTKPSHVVTIQFHENLLNFPILKKRMFLPIKTLLGNAGRGIQFQGESAKKISEKMLAMSHLTGFDASLEFFSLLNVLATAPEQRLIASSAFDTSKVIRDSKSRRIATICEYIHKNYMNPIKVSDISETACISDSALSHFFKSRTKINLIDYINDVRIGHATKMLLETTHGINEISYQCGFNNISNFNRIFKNSKGCTPTKYREDIQQILTKY